MTKAAKVKSKSFVFQVLPGEEVSLCEEAYYTVNIIDLYTEISV